VYTIIDHNKYETKAGDIIEHQKKLLVVRPTVINKLARRRESVGGDFTYCVFTFARDKKEECRTGEDIEFVKRFSAASVLKFKPKDGKLTDDEWLKPFNYREIFAPRSVVELRRLVGQAPPVGSYEQSAGALDDVDNEPADYAVVGSESASESSIDDLL
jgi:hypothetical protein